MNREVHVRFWERAEVDFLRATRQNRTSSVNRSGAYLLKFGPSELPSEMALLSHVPHREA